ncbi:hypothetical protein MKY37_20155 [Psychrobacillus sp. FSL K6-2836]|uniref:hypothetical protein n=1 Tax=Psychrobacillus sp. FSL K6-2836 TaxID=2921548 RepID=UPI0030F52374
MTRFLRDSGQQDVGHSGIAARRGVICLSSIFQLVGDESPLIEVSLCLSIALLQLLKILKENKNQRKHTNAIAGFYKFLKDEA